MPPTYVPSARPPSRRIFLTRFGCIAGPPLEAAATARSASVGRHCRGHRADHHGLMDGGRIDLQHLDVVGALELVVDDARGLEDAITRLERVLAVALVDEPDPALEDVEHLEVAEVPVEAGGVQLVVARRFL